MTTNAQIGEVTALIRVGELAMEMYRADAEAKRAREAYYGEVKKFEERFAGGQRIKVDGNDPQYARCCLYTREEFLEFDSAKKKAYRAKRKLLQACAKMGGGSK